MGKTTYFWESPAIQGTMETVQIGDGMRKTIVSILLLLVTTGLLFAQEMAIPTLSPNALKLLASKDTAPTIPTDAQFDRELKRKSDTAMIAGFVASGLVAGIAGGYLIDRALYWKPVTTVTITPASTTWEETGPAPGQWVTTPASSSTRRPTPIRAPMAH